jgi:hypothetical protein
MHLEMKIRNFIAALFTILAISAAPATAAYTPVLTWERGVEQSITLGGNTDTTLWNIELRSEDGTVFPLERSGKSKSGYFVYTILLPENLKVGRYSIYATALGTDPALTSYVDVVPLKNLDPANDPKSFGFVATIAFMVLSMLASAPQHDSSSKREARPEEPVEGSHRNDPTFIDYKENLEDNEERGLFDLIGYGKVAAIRRLDAARFSTSNYTPHYSPLASRIASDGSWFQALFGPLVLLLPVAGVFVGVKLAMATDMTLSLIPSNLTLVTLALILGVADAASGLIIAITYATYAIATQNLVNTIDLKAILGLSLIFFAPVLLAGTLRPLRRPKDEWNFAERSADLVVAPLFSAFAVQGLFRALDGLSHQRTALSAYALHFGLIAGGAILARYLLEDIATRLAPARLNYLVPTYKIPQDVSFYVAALSVKVALFFLFLYNFLGFSWQLFAGLVMLLIPQLLKRVQVNFPNSPALFQFLPSGLPQMVVMGLLGLFLSGWVNSLPLLAADKTKTIAILLGIPGLVLGLIKAFGRSPAEGDQKWYCRPQSKAIYYIGGPILIAIATAQQLGVFS